MVRFLVVVFIALHWIWLGMINLYLSWFKAKQIRKATEDFGEPIEGFTRKLFFYFFVKDGYKYIHKDSLRAVYSNADTYSSDEYTPNYCLINNKPNSANFDIIMDYIINGGSLIPMVKDIGKFLVHPMEQGEILTEVNESEFFELKNIAKDEPYTPFYNSMCYNLIKTKEGVKLIDFKHFEKNDGKPFFIYMNNYKSKINKLYIEHGENIEDVREHLAMDYKVQQMDVVFYGVIGDI